MFLFILGIVFGLVGIGALLWRKSVKPDANGRYTGDQRDGRLALLVVGPLFTLGALATIFASCFNQVGTKEVGIELAFGKPVGHLTNGPHLTYPWVSVVSMDGAIQTDSFSTDQDCILVRIGNLQTGCAHVTIQWRINPGQSDFLYQNYRSFDHVRDALVTRNLTAAVNEVLANYNPLTQISEENPTGQSKALLIQYQTQIKALLTQKVAGQVEILNVLLPVVTFDQATQDRINQLQQQVAQTLIARQQQKTNAALAAANDKLSKSVDTSPNVLVAQCFALLSQMEKDRQTIPAGFSCWPGGGSQAVIANSK